MSTPVVPGNEAAVPADEPEVPALAGVPWRQLRYFDENRARFPVQQLLPYMGKVVAWLPDGTGIRDADDTFGALWKRLRDEGENPSMFVYEAIPAF
jgi:hypothetical protein